MRITAGLAAAALALAGCASPLAALLADEDGGVGAVAVIDPSTGAEKGALTERDTETRLTGAVRPRPLTRNYSELLSAMPAAPRVFTLYFVEGTTELTAESRQTLNALRAAITPVSDVQITGHTDTTGDAAANDRLSVERATQVRTLLAAQGLPVENAKVTGRGQRELKVQTGPGVSEAANRRVEVIVR